MANIFNKVQSTKLKRNLFDLSHERKFSANMGDLIPIFCQDVVPGDTFRVNAELMMRMAPMKSPVMHRVNVYTHFFYVPYRLIWNQPDFEKWITGGEVGDTPPIFPQIRVSPEYGPTENWPKNHIGDGTLWDYLGLPSINKRVNVDGDVEEAPFNVSALPFRAYQTIFNEWYRDQDLIDEIEVSKASGIVPYEELIDTLLPLRKRAWEKDYFTSARPWAQKGEAVSLPMGAAGDLNVELSGTGTPKWKSLQGGNQIPVEGNIEAGSGGYSMADNSGVKMAAYYDPEGSLKVDMSQTDFTAATITELRRVFQLQKWLERNARSGTRYTELLKAHFGVKSSDGRLQRPEYLGGGRQPVTISEVLQTSQTTENSPQGEMAGHGLSIGKSNRFKRFFEEHGLVIGIMSVMPRTSYQQGIPRMFQKFDRFDHYWPEFAHIGEQEIKNKEIYYNPLETESGTSNEDTFGYAPRYSEYKYIPSTVHGDFRDTLDFWHMGRIFDMPSGQHPKLNADFVNSNPTHRIFNVVDQNHHKLWVHLYNNVKAVRPMPVFGNPGLIDH